MKRTSHLVSPPNLWNKFGMGAVVLALLALHVAADDSTPARHPEERDGAATIIHRADVIRNRGTNGSNSAPMRLWPLLSTPEARMNYVEVAGPSSLHFHPDADHRLYVLEGSVVVTAGTNVTTASIGDLIIIPKGVRHSYDVPAKGDRALLLTFDAPPYDPRKTVNVGSSQRPSGEEPRKQ
ncbi:MAG TPA: cupin domain-containing protein [Verrucomicrobiae bacterium]|jgi:quercetin dioxygenase-like cupin family protein|nr:cupin domain-containing protein [Verrucomicrobiae bacterium]